MVDFRSPQEFMGEILAPPGLLETCQRGGHIPHARRVPWGKACNEDGTSKSAGELKALYGREGVDRSKPVIAWTERGNLVGAPVERGSTAAKSVNEIRQS
jgi:thiosulfate/3-mercaptopyruvate sulfurtransferase